MPIKTKSNYYTPEEYLALEQASETRNEFHDGAIIPIEATTKNHNTIVTNFLLNSNIPRLRKNGCRLFHENVITEVDAPKKKGVYPDIVVTCNEEDRRDALVVKHPVLIVEVLSKSTANYDRGDKFFLYKQISSLQEYVLIEQDKYVVEVYYQKEKTDLWSITRYSGLEEVIKLQSTNTAIKMSALYFDIGLEEQEV